MVDYYIGAGALAQTVWNYMTNRSLNYGINDIDITYFNKDRLEETDEIEIKENLKKELGSFPLWLDVKNQARVHIWYKEKYGYEIEAYKTIEEAITTWPTTSTAIGVRRINKKNWKLYVPYGLNDLFDLKVVANPKQITESIYIKKVERWRTEWPELKVVDWTNEKLKVVNNDAISVVRG